MTLDELLASAWFESHRAAANRGAPEDHKERQMTHEQVADESGTLPGMELVPLGPTFTVDSYALASCSGPVTLDQCGSALRRVTRIKDAVRYWRGDLLNLAETLFAEEASQIVDVDLMTEQEANAERFVAAKVAATTRAHAQSWEHAKIVAALKPEDQVEWLDRSRADDWSARKLASEIAQAKSDGKTVMRWWLVVECGTEAKRDKLAADLEARGGFTVKRQEKMAKVAKPKRAKRGPVTAQRKHKGAPKLNTRKRVPK